MRRVLVYLDPVSPYAWLGARDLGRITAAGVETIVVPVLFAGLLDTHGNLGPAEIPVKRRYVFHDVMREAARRGLPFAGPPGHPFNPLLALRVLTALAEDAARRRLALALLAACWEQGEDLTDAAAVRRLADAAGCDGAALIAQAGTAAIKTQLADTTAQAAADGVFGVPTFRVDGESALFWGADRIDALLWHLQGHALDGAALDAVLARAAAAERRR